MTSIASNIIDYQTINKQKSSKYDSIVINDLVTKTTNNNAKCYCESDLELNNQKNNKYKIKKNQCEICNKYHCSIVCLNNHIKENHLEKKEELATLCLLKKGKINVENNSNKYSYLSKIDNFEFIKLKNNNHILSCCKHGFVYLTRNIKDNKFYAIKKLDKLIIKEKEKNYNNYINVLYKTFELVAKIDHVLILKIYSIFEDNSYIYIVCEYARGGNLFDKTIIDEYNFKKCYNPLLCKSKNSDYNFKEGNNSSFKYEYFLDKNSILEENEVFKYFIQIISALNFLHENNIIHRNLKLNNIFLDENDNIKLSGFSFSIKLDSSNNCNNYTEVCNTRNTFCGTFEYMAPELILEKPYNFSVDIWSLGVILYELIHGYSPFRIFVNNNKVIIDDMDESIINDNINNDVNDYNPDNENYYSKLFNNIINKNYAIGEFVSTNLKSLFNIIFDLNPNNRITIIQILKQPWIEEFELEFKENRIKEIQNDINMYNSNNTTNLHTCSEDIFEEVMNTSCCTLDEPDAITNFRKSVAFDYLKQKDNNNRISYLNNKYKDSNKEICFNESIYLDDICGNRKSILNFDQYNNEDNRLSTLFNYNSRETVKSKGKFNINRLSINKSNNIDKDNNNTNKFFIKNKKTSINLYNIDIIEEQDVNLETQRNNNEESLINNNCNNKISIEIQENNINNSINSSTIVNVKNNNSCIYSKEQYNISISSESNKEEIDFFDINLFFNENRLSFTDNKKGRMSSLVIKTASNLFNIKNPSIINKYKTYNNLFNKDPLRPSDFIGNNSYMDIYFSNDKDRTTEKQAPPDLTCQIKEKNSDFLNEFLMGIDSLKKSSSKKLTFTDNSNNSTIYLNNNINGNNINQDNSKKNNIKHNNSILLLNKSNNKLSNPEISNNQLNLEESCINNQNLNKSVLSFKNPNIKSKYIEIKNIKRKSRFSTKEDNSYFNISNNNMKSLISSRYNDEELCVNNLISFTCYSIINYKKENNTLYNINEKVVMSNIAKKISTNLDLIENDIKTFNTFKNNKKSNILNKNLDKNFNAPFIKKLNFDSCEKTKEFSLYDPISEEFYKNKNVQLKHFANNYEDYNNNIDKCNYYNTNEDINAFNINYYRTKLIKELESITIINNKENNKNKCKYINKNLISSSFKTPIIKKKEKCYLNSSSTNNSLDMSYSLYSGKSCPTQIKINNLNKEADILKRANKKNKIILNSKYCSSENNTKKETGFFSKLKSFFK